MTVRAELSEADARKLQFKVEVRDEDKKVGDDTHGCRDGRNRRLWCFDDDN